MYCGFTPGGSPVRGTGGEGDEQRTGADRREELGQDDRSQDRGRRTAEGARSLLELHGGTLSVDSTPGHGATFRCALPLATT